MMQKALTEIAQKAFSGRYVGKMLRAYRPTEIGIEIDVVPLDQAEPKLELVIDDTCIKKHLTAGSLSGGQADPVKAFQTCLAAGVLDALIVTNEPLPQLDNLVPRIRAPHGFADGRKVLGWLYHLERDRNLTIYEYEGRPPQLSVLARGQFKVFGAQPNSAPIELHWK